MLQGAEKKRLYEELGWQPTGEYLRKRRLRSDCDKKVKFTLIAAAPACW